MNYHIATPHGAIQQIYLIYTYTKQHIPMARYVMCTGSFTRSPNLSMMLHKHFDGLVVPLPCSSITSWAVEVVLRSKAAAAAARIVWWRIFCIIIAIFLGSEICDCILTAPRGGQFFFDNYCDNAKGNGIHQEIFCSSNYLIIFVYEYCLKMMLKNI